MTDQLTPQQEREYVEARWIRAEIFERDYVGHQQLAVSLGDKDYTWHCTEWVANKLSAWNAAFLYTKEHERKIADVENEIELLRWTGTRGYDTKEQCASHDRLVAVEQSRLAELMRGWKGEA